MFAICIWLVHWTFSVDCFFSSSSVLSIARLIQKRLRKGKEKKNEFRTKVSISVCLFLRSSRRDRVCASAQRLIKVTEPSFFKWNVSHLMKWNFSCHLVFQINHSIWKSIREIPKNCESWCNFRASSFDFKINQFGFTSTSARLSGECWCDEEKIECL